MTQLRSLAKPFHESLVEIKPGKGNLSYVAHSVVTERALATLGPFSTEVKEVIYRDGKVDGVLLTLICEIDGRTVRITEAGEGDNPTAKTNGALLKDAISDAVKRCFMRTGLGLSLWSGKLYSLDRVLERNEKQTEKPVDSPQPSAATGTPEKAVETPETPVETAEKAAENFRNGVAISAAAATRLKKKIADLGVLYVNEADLIESALGIGALDEFGELNQAQAGKVWAYAESEAAKEETVEQKKAAWESWRSKDDPVLWAVDQTDDHGTELFKHLAHAQNSFDKANREYLNSLEEDARPKPDDSRERKWENARALYAYFFQKVGAKKRGEEFVLPAAGSQRIFEDIDEHDAVPFEQLGDYQNVPPGPQGT